MLQTFLRHPRKLWIRRALFQVHLWAGVLVSVYVVVIALTGSVLVFRSELSRVQLPKSLSAYDASRVAPLGTVVERFKAEYPEAKIDEVELPSAVMPAFLLTATDAGHRPLAAVADAVTGKIMVQPRTWLDVVYDLHVYLLLGKAYGIQVNGVGAACLLLLSVTGLFLWWPGLKIWARGLRIGWNRNWRRINFDAHNAIGFWTLLLVSWWAISGVYFAWYRQVTAVVTAVSPLKGMRSPEALPVGDGTGHATLDQVLAAVRQASPNGRLFSLSDPTLSGATVYAEMDRGAVADFSHRDIIMVSTRDARILSVWHYGQNVSAGDWFLWAMHPLHFGTLWGLAFKIVWALGGAALALLSVTGLLMYWNRSLRHRLAG